jgi:threonine dehydrogenase-like Zn-dependent dehydrogenase
VTLISPGTERAFLLGLPNAQSRFPNYPGYSNVGRVAAVGPGVEGLAVGDRAAAMVGHASHAVAAAARCAKVPEGVAPAAAVYFSLGAIALQAIRKTRTELGEAMAVLGLGLIGNLALQLGRLQGALPAVGLEPDAGRRALALECGADACFDPGEADTPAALAAATGGGPAVVVEATGAPEAINQAFAAAAVGGRVVLLASTRGVTETNFYRDVHKKGLTVLGAHNAARPPRDSSPGFWTLEDDFRVVLRLLAGGRLRVAPLTSAVLPAAEAPAAYAALATWRKDQLGVLLRWKEPEG